MGKFKKISLKTTLLVMVMFITAASLFLIFRENTLKKGKASTNEYESLSELDNGWKLYSGQNTTMNIDASINSVELSTDGTVPAFIRNNNLHEDFSQYTGIKLSLNVHKPKDIAKISFYVSNDIKFTNYAVAGFNQNSMLVGENFLSVGKSGFTKYNNFNWNEPIKAVQIRFETINNKPAKIIINKLYSLTHNKGKIVFTMDDAWNSQYNVAYQLMKKYSFPGTIGVITSATGGTKMNIEQLKELQNNGWAIINHTNTHKRLDTLPIEQQIEEIETAKTWLLDNGFDSGSKFIVYPYGAYTTEIIDYLEKNHYYAARSLVNEIQINRIRPFELKTINLTYNVDVPRVKTIIDNAIDTGGTIFFLNHRFDEKLNSMSYSPSKFEEILKYVYEKQQKGYIDVMNIIDWYDNY